MINKSNKKSLIEGVHIDNINIESDIIRVGYQNHQRSSQTQSQGHGHKHSSNNNLNNKYHHNN